MKKTIFVTLFLSVQVLLIFLQIYKHSSIVDQMYRHQSAEKKQEQLLREKQELLQARCKLHNRAAVAEYAKNELKMSDVKLSQIKKYSHDQSL